MTGASDIQNGVGRRWAVVLAGGAGRRLESLTTDARGVRVPKQYCALRGDRSLLQMALARAERLVPDDRVVVVVQRDHRSWWGRELADLPPENVLVQPRDRGTAVGLALTLLAIRRRDPGATVVILPADHFVAREDLLAEGIEVAFAEAEGAPERVVLLAVASSRPDVGLGWIVPERAGEPAEVLAVAEFREKPSRPAMRTLLERGALVNCFVSVGRIGTFLRLLEVRPEVVERLAPLLLTGRLDPGRLAAAYERLPRVDLSAHVFEGATDHLGVLRLPEVGWTDLGTPASVRRCLVRHRIPVLPARSGYRAPVDLSTPRPVGLRTVCLPAADLARYTEML
jgi:mannose-1-phosphate guanylyltransferase